MKADNTSLLNEIVYLKHQINHLKRNHTAGKNEKINCNLIINGNITNKVIPTIRVTSVSRATQRKASKHETNRIDRFQEDKRGRVLLLSDSNSRHIGALF